MQPPKPYREERPWGEFIKFAENTPCTVKILTIKAHEAFSLQTHEHRAEFWHVISGSGRLTDGTNVTDAKPGDEQFIAIRTAHRIEAGDQDMVVLELSFGDFDEADIVHLEDRYGRATGDQSHTR